MNVYDHMTEALTREFDTVGILKESSRGCVSVLRHRKSGTRYVFRHYKGSGEVYLRLREIQCPNLPEIYEVGTQDGQTAVLEEYVQGDSLYDLLAAGPLSVKEARGVMKQLCAALWTLHSLGAVHRDIKPENVLLRGDEAVLIDFDASRLVKQSQDADTQVLGTTGYAAPEQYGITQSDTRADIFSMGILLNILLTGKHPSETIVGGRMGRIVRKCTMIHPKKRFKNVLHLMEAL